MAIPVWSGRNATVVFLLKGAKLEVPIASGSVTRRGVESDDDFCGADRSEPDFETQGFDIDLDFKQRKAEFLEAMIDYQADLDSLVQPEESAVAFVIKPNDGTNIAFQARGRVTPGAWNFQFAGKQKNSGKCPLKAQYWEKVPTL